MRAFEKDFLREMKKNRGRLISVFFIVLLGAAFFSGIRSSQRDMLRSAERYYDQTALMDLRVVSTLGLTEADLADLAALEQVSQVTGGKTLDVLCGQLEKSAVRLIGLTDNVNQVQLTEGRLPQNAQECVVDAAFLQMHDYAVGDWISFSSGTDAPLSDSLSRERFQIVGSGNLPYYMSMERGSCSIGTGELAGFVLVMPEVFVQEVYTEAYLLLDGAAELDSYAEPYAALSQSAKTAVTDLADQACQRRYDELYRQGSDEIAEAQRQLDDAEAAQQQTQTELDDAAAQLETARDQLQTERQTLSQSQAQLQTGRQSLAAAQQAYQERQSQFAQAEQELSQRQAELEQAQAQLEASRPEYEQGCQLRQTLCDTQQQLTQTLSQARQQLQELEQAGLTGSDEYLALQQQIQELEGQLSSLEQQLETLDAQLQEFETNEQQLQAGQQELEAGRTELDSARQQLQTAAAELAAWQAQLDSGAAQINQGQQELEQAESQLAQKQEELDAANTEFAQALEDSQPELEEARTQIQDAQAQLDALQVPQWYVLDREQIASCVNYKNDAERIANLGKLFPVIFFLVAALVSLTAMTRMVQEQRQQTGTLKALGCSDRAILLRCLGYAMIPTVSGAVLGVLLGEKLLPLAILSTYQLLYTGLTDFEISYNLEQGAIAVLASVLCTGGASLGACYWLVRACPAQIMRPESPPAGKRVILEHLGFFWRRLNFTQKSTLRNLLRYKKRFFMTVIGVAGCMALVLVGFGLHDSIMVVVDQQFSELTHYHASVSLESDCSDGTRQELIQALAARSEVDTVIEDYEMTVDAHAGSATQTVTLMVPNADGELLQRYFTYRDRKSHTPYVLDASGALLSEKTATALGVKAGDTVYVNTESGAQIAVPVAAVVENYIGHNLVLTPELYQQLWKQAPDWNQLLLRNNDTSQTAQDALGSFLLTAEGVQGVSFVSDLIEWADDTLLSLNTIVYILLAAAALLAFVVLYSLNSINIAERRRELATLKVLGFYDPEVAAYVYRENVLLTLLGILLGCGLGAILHGYVIRSVEVDLIMFGRSIAPVSYLLGAGMTLLFSAALNAVMYRSLERIDMIQSLKSVE